MKILTKKDNVSIVFGEWFDKNAGNTYYDAHLYIGDIEHKIPYTYGYNHGDKQAVDESLAKCGYKVRVNKSNTYAPYKHIHVIVHDKKYRELYR